MRTLYGIHPVRELVRVGAEGLAELWLAEGSRGQEIASLAQAARTAGAIVHSAPRARLDRLAGTDRHQGVVALVADYRYHDLEALLSEARIRGEPSLLVVLDGIEDPQNLGAIIRSAHVLGAHGVVIPKNRTAGVTAAVAKASAGAIEYCTIARVTNIAQSIEILKKNGVWSVATAQDGERLLAEVDLTGPVVIVIGSEGKGIRPLVLRTCDYIARIPMTGKVGSLNAAASAAIVLYEAVRQRRVARLSAERAGSGESEGESRS